MANRKGGEGGGGRKCGQRYRTFSIEILFMFDLNRRIKVRHQNGGVEGGAVQTVMLLCTFVLRGGGDC